MKILNTILLLAAVSMAQYAHAEDNNAVFSTKQERNFIHEGNKLYRDNRFADSEVMYRKALQAVPTSETAMFNLAASLIRQSGSSDPNSGNNPIAEATQMLQQLSSTARDMNIAEKAFYNLGNIAFNQENYQQSIEMYKNALRKNPDNDKTRQNLRLAQLKLKEQQQNKDDKKDDKQQQDKQEQKQEQNKDNQDNKQNQDQQQKDEDKKPQNQPQQQSNISDANADKILKAMENEEAATRRRVEAQQKKDANSSRRQVTNPG